MRLFLHHSTTKTYFARCKALLLYLSASSKVKENPPAAETGKKLTSLFSQRIAFTLKPLAACLAIILIATSTFAQTVIKGTVTDEKGAVLPGTSVVIKGTTTGAMTNVNGKFTLNATVGQTLVFTMLGYDRHEVKVTGTDDIIVSLTPSASSLNEVVVVGYNKQKRASITTAVSTVSGSDILTTKNENVVNSLAGKVPGLRVVQNSAEPGDFNNSFDIRGMGSPLLVVDGVPRTDIMRIDPNDIESVSVLKDASAAVYGVRAANGVILVTTKRGKKGTLELNFNSTYGYQLPISFPSTVGVADWMILNNEKNMHNVNGGSRIYTDADIAAYQNGTKQGYNWYDAVVKKSAPQTQQNLTASGGNENSNYFLSLGYTGQDGILKSNDLYYKRYNVRSNITTKVTKNLTFDLNLAGIMEQKTMPYNAPYWSFRSLWYVPPITPIYANDNPGFLNNVANVVNPLALTDANVNGYQLLNNKYFQSSASLTYNVPGVKGLSAKLLYSYDINLTDNKKYMKAFNLYSYNAATNAYIPTPQQTPGTVRRELYSYPTDLSQMSLNYTRSFGGHNISGLVLFETGDRYADNFYAQREVSIDVDQLIAGNSLNQQGSMSGSATALNHYSNAGLVGSFNYDYKSKYFGGFSFRYDGSSRFGPGRQWGLFPVGSIGWRVSEEDFWKNSALSFIDNFKLRASYGKTGDDSASSYQFISGYNYPASGSATGLPAGGVFDGVFVNSSVNKGIPNPAITWYTSKTLDIGTDIEVVRGLLGVTFDWYRRNRTGLLITQALSLPDVVGAPLPQQNLNGDRAQGFDFEINHRNSIGKFNYNVRGTFGYTRLINTIRVQARAGNSYLNWLNSTNTAYRNNNIYWGYGSAGQFENWNAIENSNIYVNRATVVGDYRYQDWNGDGQIGSDDSHPIASTGLPLMTFGLNIAASYKNFDINLLFQGAAMSYASYLEQLNTPLWAGGGALTQFLDRYHPQDPNANPYDPNTVWVPGHFAYTGTVPYTNTLSNLQNASYVRLKSAELGYTLPNSWASKIGIRGARIFVNGYNLLTFTGLLYMDPEHPSATSAIDQQFGYIYPLDRILQFGVNLKL